MTRLKHISGWVYTYRLERDKLTIEDFTDMLKPFVKKNSIFKIIKDPLHETSELIQVNGKYIAFIEW